jgi:perosamine synthetase
MTEILQMEPVYDKEDIEAVVNYLHSDGWLMEHDQTEELEKMMCKITKAKYCSMVPNGTLSLMACLSALKIKPGNEVIVPDYIIIASATAASFIGAKPVFVDIEPETLAIDFEQLKKKINKKTKAIMLVDMNGRPPRDWVEILKIAHENNIPVVEDAAQTLGSYFNVEPKIHLGTLGAFGSFSFSMSKIMTMGSGGAIITHDKNLYTTIELMKDFGREHGGKDVNIYPGIDLKFTDLQAVIGISMLKKFPARVKRKKEIFKIYREELKDYVEFLATDLKYTVPWSHDIFLKNKKEKFKLIAYLNSKKIFTRVMYPAIHTQKPFFDLSSKYPVSVNMSNRGLWLPSSLKLTNDDILYVCKEVKRGVKK